MRFAAKKEIQNMSKEARDKKLEQLLKAPLDVEDKRSPE
tara:strand:+ start:1191 stop:1307 length:117 start_codon:yes stop_codon:yes gene_type:complete